MCYLLILTIISINCEDLHQPIGLNAIGIAEISEGTNFVSEQFKFVALQKSVIFFSSRYFLLIVCVGKGWPKISDLTFKNKAPFLFI